MLNSLEMEESAYQWWRKSLQHFLSSHTDEVYFGLAAVTNPFDPGLFLCLGCENPIHTVQLPNPFLTEKQRREIPEEWCYESFDLDLNTASDFNNHFFWLDPFCQEITTAHASRMGSLFESFIEALIRALIRIEKEFVISSSRFSHPCDVFVAFEEDDLQNARQRYDSMRLSGQLTPGWSRSIFTVSSSSS
jgi:hypothetical protein